MLPALGRDERIALILGVVFELEGEDAAAIVEIEPAAHATVIGDGSVSPRAPSLGGVQDPHAIPGG